MTTNHWRVRWLTLVLALLASTGVRAGEWSGFAALDYRGFAHAPLYADQHQDYFSLALQPEFVHTLEGSKDSLRFTGFARVDQYDSSRSHADIRELSWLKVGDGIEWRVGIRKVFWGVTESQHLVDIVNQTDLVENFDGEDKLGQPMINLALTRNWGTVDLFALPYFRERTFPGAHGRLRSQPRVDTDQAVYESSRGKNHVDAALRWSKSWSGIDMGLSHFAGTSRDPRLVLGSDKDGTPVLVPHYDLIHQTGLDLTTATDAWLWKLEAIHRSGQTPSPYVAATAGVEYTFSSTFGTGVDAGILAEYLYDERGNASPSPFQDDVMLGLRLAFNDAQNSELLLGVIDDRRSRARFLNLETSRRLGDKWKLSLEARAFTGIPQTDTLYSMRRDDYVQLELVRYF